MTKPPKVTKAIATICGKPIDLTLNLGRVYFGQANDQDLGDLEDGPITGMFLDPRTLGEAVWGNYRDLIEAAGIETEEDFRNSFDGETRRSVEEAMKEAVRDFFPWGPALLTQIEKKIAAIPDLIDALDPSGQTSGNTPDSSDIPRGNTPTAS